MVLGMQGYLGMLLDAVDQAATDRSEDPTPMERSVIDRILTTASNKRQQ